MIDDFAKRMDKWRDNATGHRVRVELLSPKGDDLGSWDVRLQGNHLDDDAVVRMVMTALHSARGPVPEPEG